MQARCTSRSQVGLLPMVASSSGWHRRQYCHQWHTVGVSLFDGVVCVCLGFDAGCYPVCCCLENSSLKSQRCGSSSCAVICVITVACARWPGAARAFLENTEVNL